MAFYSTSLGSPSICIRGNVMYEQQTLSPDSGLYNFSNPSYNNWSFPNSLNYQNGRIRGNYPVESKFEQGYFNFENWNGRVVSSIDGTKSGYQSVVSASSTPYLANFWGRGEHAVSRDALYNYENNGNTYKPKNITTACVMSGNNLGVTGIYPNLKVYMGSIPSGELTIYGRVGSTNPNYGYTDKILSFNVPTVLAGGGGGSSTTTAYTLPSLGQDGMGIGTADWNNPENITGDDNTRAYNPNIFGTSLSHYLMGTGYSFPTTGATVTAVDLQVLYTDVSNSPTDYLVQLLYNGSLYGTDKALHTSLAGGGLRTYSWSSGELGGLTGTQIADSTFGAAIVVQGGGGLDSAGVDYFKMRVTYTTGGGGGGSGDGLSGSLTLVNRYDGNNRRLNWVVEGFDDPVYIDMPNAAVNSTEFNNFLLSYSSSDGIGRFYTAKDDEPFHLENIVALNDIVRVFSGETTFYEDSYGTASGTVINNPKIITDYGISNRAWTQSDISEFDNHRINGAYWIGENPSNNSPSPSGSDSTSLCFHFPVKSSGLLGSCHSGNPYALSYYVPLSSGINNRLAHFDRSQVNPTSLTLNFWASNTGTNPSGNIGARINFCSRSGFFTRELYTPTYYWSGFPVSLSSGIRQVTMSGYVFNSQGQLADLSEVSKSDANNAQLFLGTWYNNIQREYNGDLRIYNANVKLDGFISPETTNSTCSLTMSGKDIVHNALDITLKNAYVQERVDLSLVGGGMVNDNFPIFISGGFAFSTLDLYLKGKESASNTCDISIDGSSTKASMNLYTYSSPPSQTGNEISLYMNASTHSGASKSLGIFIGDNAPSGYQTTQMNLFTKGPESIRLTAGMNLFMDSDAPVNGNSVTLFCCNQYTGASGYLTMFLKTKAGTYGAIPASGEMNLFLARSTESVAHNFPISISGPLQSQGNIPLSIIGANKSNGDIPIYTNGIGICKDTLKIYTHGF